MSRVFSGIQPSGELHIGNYLGAVKNWVELQSRLECIYCIVDYHAITGAYEPADLKRRTRDMAVSLLAAGVDPEKCTLFVQSMVPEHTELAWIFNTVTPLGELERQTQFKDKASKQESVPAGLLNYPVLQAADILLYRADQVPVGEDQVQHLELSREIARNWNAKFGVDFFPEPKPLLTATRRIMGLDGQAKMSKSMGNAIGILEEQGRDLGQAAAGGHRSGTRAEDRSGNAGSVRHLSPPQGVQRRAHGGERRDAMHDGGLGLHRLQAGARRVARTGIRADPRTREGVRGESETRDGHSFRRRRARPQDRGRNAAAGERDHGARVTWHS